MPNPTRIGILTGGGDCPGLNAVIRAVTKTAIIEYGWEVIGFEDGFEGLINNQWQKLDYESVSGILALGGTILGTSNKANPFGYIMKDEAGNWIKKDLSEQCMTNYRNLGLSALVAVGGDGTLTMTNSFAERGLNMVGVPKTIDNDISGTDQTFGFETAVEIITDAVDKIHTTAMSHKRAMVIEVMGRNSGWLALYGGVAGGGDIILLPELPYSIDKVCEKVLDRSQRGKKFTIIVVAEGAKEIGGSQIVDRVVEDSPDPVRLGGIGRMVGKQIEERTGIETRVTVLGHLQRGGGPTAFDRILCTQMGKKAVDMIANQQFGQVVVLRNGKLETAPVGGSANKQRLVTSDHPVIAAARAVGTSFGTLAD